MDRRSGGRDNYAQTIAELLRKSMETAAVRSSSS